MKLKNLPKIVMTHIPGIDFLYRVLHSRHFLSKGTGGTNSARYCYSVYLRHLVMAEAYGLPTRPESVAELGPGDSLGIGLCALLTGARNYYAFDVTTYSSNKRNMEVMKELVQLFEDRESIPDSREFPTVKPYLESYVFPDHILTEQRLDESLDPRRIESIKTALLQMGMDTDDSITIAYIAPWDDPSVIGEKSIDMIFSQAVMEHVENLAQTYEASYRWLKPGGYVSHQIDFKSHGTAKKWNGHWAYSDSIWDLLKGKRSWLINRESHSTHLWLLKKNNFTLVCDDRIEDHTGIPRNKLAPRFRDISDEDLVTSGAFIQALKE